MLRALSNHRCLVALSLLAGQALTAAALGQSLNIDINRTTGSGAGVPSNSYGAAAGQPGVWNNVPTTDSNNLALVGLNGAGSGLTITTNLSGGASSSSGSASSDFGRLMWDYADSCCSFQATQELRVNGLDEGNYWLYVYAALPGDVGFFPDPFTQTPWYYGTSVSAYLDLNPDTNLGNGTTSGPVVPDEFTPGVNYFRIPIKVPAGAPPLLLSVGGQFTNSDSNVKSAINGLQLKQMTATRLYVDANASANSAQTGESWAAAMKSLSQALQAAKTWGVNEIWVANGTYLPPSRTQSFDIPSGVKIYGGFAGNEALLTQRNIAANVAYLSGNVGNIFSTTDNCYQVVDASNTNSSTLLDGFTITSGNANYEFNVEQQRGAGIVGENCDATFRNCTIRLNQALSDGGGVYLFGDSDANFIQCDFYSNVSGEDGGGLYVEGATSFVDVWNCRFVSNTATDRGAGVFHGGQNMRVVNTLFNYNQAGSLSGGLYAFASGHSTILSVANSTFYRNIGVNSAGLRVFGTGTDVATCTVTNSVFHFNTTTNTDLSESLNVSKAPSAILNVDYSWISGLSGSLGGTGNRGATGDPGFMDRFGPDGTLGTLDEDFNLNAFSVTVDSGNDTLLPADSFDVDGDSNIFEILPIDQEFKMRRIDDHRTDNANPAWNVDMGAYERRECFFDYNGDGFVDDFDFVVFSQYYEQFAASGGDFNGDGFTDDTDFVYFTQAYQAFACE